MEHTRFLAGMLPYFPSGEWFAFWPYTTAVVGSGYFFVIAATILTFVLIGVSLLVKYIPLLYNDIQAATDQQFPAAATKLWIFIIVILPFFATAAPLLYPAWWFLLLRTYMNKNEKGAALVIAAFIFMSAMITHTGAAFLTYPHTQVNREIFLTDHGLADSKDYLTIDAWVKENPGDADALNARALLDIRKGDYSAAALTLDQCLSIDPASARYYNHLGIALAKEGRNREALKAFGNSISLEPQNPVYHYNLSRTHQQMLNFYAAEKSVMAASDLAPARVRELLDMESHELQNNFVIDATPVTTLIARQMKTSTELEDAADGLWNLIMGVFPRGRATMAAFFYLILLLLLDRIPQDKFSKKCHRCGRLYYVGGLSQKGLPLCLQCEWINSKENRNQQVVADKADDVRQYRKDSRIQLKKLEKILPGMGLIMGDRMLDGSLRLFTISSGIILIVSGGQIIHSIIPAPAGSSSALLLRLAGLIIISLAYWRSSRFEPARIGG